MPDEADDRDVKLLLVGRGPVAQVLAASARRTTDVVLATRDDAPGTLALDVARHRHQPRRSRRTTVLTLPLAEAAAREWDVVLTTAPVEATALGTLLAASPRAALASVTQVPSEADALAHAADGRPWGLVAPGFLAQGRDEVRWWQPGGAGVGLAGEAADMLREALDPHCLRLKDVPAFAPLHAAVVPMATVAMLERHGWDRRRAAADARRIVAVVRESGEALAAAYGGTPARAVAPVVASVLRILQRVTPFDVDAYARDHFGRHSVQTRTLLGDWVRLGECFDRPARTTAALLAELTAATPRSAATV